MYIVTRALKSNQIVGLWQKQPCKITTLFGKNVIFYGKLVAYDSWNEKKSALTTFLWIKKSCERYFELMLICRRKVHFAG
jgi:hypothetical protein